MNVMGSTLRNRSVVMRRERNKVRSQGKVQVKRLGGATIRNSGELEFRLDDGSGGEPRRQE